MSADGVLGVSVLRAAADACCQALIVQAVARVLDQQEPLHAPAVRPAYCFKHSSVEPCAVCAMVRAVNGRKQPNPWRS